MMFSIWKQNCLRNAREFISKNLSCFTACLLYAWSRWEEFPSSFSKMIIFLPLFHCVMQSKMGAKPVNNFKTLPLWIHFNKFVEFVVSLHEHRCHFLICNNCHEHSFRHNHMWSRYSTISFQEVAGLTIFILLSLQEKSGQTLISFGCSRSVRLD